MPAEPHSQIASFIWSRCNLLRGPCKRNEYRKAKVGYEIPLNRHFYRYAPPRPLEVIERDIRGLEAEIVALLREVTVSE